MDLAYPNFGSMALVAVEYVVIVWRPVARSAVEEVVAAREAVAMLAGSVEWAERSEVAVRAELVQAPFVVLVERLALMVVMRCPLVLALVWW